MRILPFDPRYRDDMIFMVLSAKDALGCVPRLNEDLLDIGQSYFQHGGGFWLALDENDRVAGCIGVLIGDRSARLHRLYVRPERKRQGIGSLLLAQAERFCVQNGAEEAVVHMGDPRYYWESIPFYEKHGYIETEPRWRKKHWGRIALIPHTRESFHAFYRALIQDPALFRREEDFRPFEYSEEKVESRFSALSACCDRVGLTVYLDQQVIGQVDLKHIDPQRGTCEMGICLARDEYKNKGFGTRAERLAVAYAFRELGMRAVTANCLIKNSRSRRVLETVGFRETARDAAFVYYEIEK